MSVHSGTRQSRAVRGPATAAAPSELGDEDLLLERYRGAERDNSRMLRAYYGLRPYMPRRAQIALRRVYAHKQARRAFPRWPNEPELVDRHREELLQLAEAHPHGAYPFVWYWPRGHRFAFVLTHDVEGPAGVDNIPAILEIEARHGVVSSFDFCAEEYPIREGVFDEVRAAGCEVGLHGIDHKCKLFSSRERFEKDLPRIHQYMRDWGAVGFRSPALHRNADWMPELDCLYDTSYPDTDPFEPQPGGCCSIFPFMMGRDLVELPLTLVQDHTLFEILRRRDIALWRDKSAWIAERHGMINVNVHPDYMLTRERLAAYEELVVFLKGLAGGWNAVAADVAAWWKAREALAVVETPDGPSVPGAEELGAVVGFARAGDDGLSLDVAPAARPA